MKNGLTEIITATDPTIRNRSLDAFCRAAISVGLLMDAAHAGVVSLGLNPVIVGARGEGCRVVDALAVTHA